MEIFHDIYHNTTGTYTINRTENLNKSTLVSWVYLAIYTTRRWQDLTIVMLCYMYNVIGDKTTQQRCSYDGARNGNISVLLEKTWLRLEHLHNMLVTSTQVVQEVSGIAKLPFLKVTGAAGLSRNSNRIKPEAILRVLWGFCFAIIPKPMLLMDLEHLWPIFI